MRRIAIMIGSDSDLKQCVRGFEYLIEAERQGLVEVVSVITNSIHRNGKKVFKKLFWLSISEVDVIIAGAGMANHLTGTADAHLRYGLRDDRLVVVGVAFEGKTEAETRAARESIIYVPGTQVVFNEYIGAEGFYRACDFAVLGELPKIVLKEGKPVVKRTLKEAIRVAKEKLREKEVK